MENELELKIIEILRKLNYHIACAESCTGGLIISSLISIPGASNVINESYVTYSNEAKERILGVNPDTIQKYHVESNEVSLEMARGLKKISGADVCISVTGFAGGLEKLPTDGLCFFTIIINGEEYSDKVQVSGNRNTARINQKNYILEKTLEKLKNL